jgi:Uma2 family endonuclease
MAVQPAPYRFTVAEYYQMAEAGILNEDDRVELLEGEIVEMAPIGSRHASCVTKLIMLFCSHVTGRAVVWAQNPVRLGELSEPQPDVALLRPRPDGYAGGHPRPEDVLLLVEVGDTTAGWDRRHKLPLYASAGVSELWLVDLVAATVHVCRRPEDGAYGEVRVAEPGHRLGPEAFPDVSIDPGDFLP